jgi:hypothetical protein
VDLESGFAASGSLTGGVTLEDYGSMKEVFADREMEVFAGIFMETERFHGREFVDCGEDFRSCEEFSLRLV